MDPTELGCAHRAMSADGPRGECMSCLIAERDELKRQLSVAWSRERDLKAQAKSLRDEGNRKDDTIAGLERAYATQYTRAEAMRNLLDRAVVAIETVPDPGLYDLKLLEELRKV